MEELYNSNGQELKTVSGWIHVITILAFAVADVSVGFGIFRYLLGGVDFLNSLIVTTGGVVFFISIIGILYLTQVRIDRNKEI
jgi:NADH:ubiquinone oxidoreductase subunit K